MYSQYYDCIKNNQIIQVKSWYSPEHIDKNLTKEIELGTCIHILIKTEKYFFSEVDMKLQKNAYHRELNVLLFNIHNIIKMKWVINLKIVTHKKMFIKLF